MTAAARVARSAVTAYQWLIAPILPPACRFAPTCSEYAKQALADHGLVRGLGLALWRLLRCQPWHPGGYDPPPRARRA